VLVGATIGGLVASFAEHELRSGLRHEIGEALKAGTAVIVSVVYRNGRASVESTLDRADTITELRMDRATINSLDEAVAEAMLSTGTTGTSS
jgi:DNA invertase Pin-like site-specific DNA recombinase